VSQGTGRKEGRMPVIVPDEKLPNVQVVADEAAKEVAVHSPYDERFVKGARKLGGKWSRDEKVWIFPLGAKDKVVALAKEVYGEEKVWEGPLPRKDELIIYRAAVYPHPDPDFRGEVLIGMVYAEAKRPEFPWIDFLVSRVQRAGPLSFFPNDCLCIEAGADLFLHPERKLPVEMEMAIRWGRPYLSPLGPELPKEARARLEKRRPYLRRFLEAGDVGECPHCGGPLMVHPKIGARLCMKCGKWVEGR